MNLYRVPEDPELDRAIWVGNYHDDVCVDCGGRQALFVVEGGFFVASCAHCLANRLTMLKAKRGALPAGIEWLLKEAEHEVWAQARRRREAGLPS